VKCFETVKNFKTLFGYVFYYLKEPWNTSTVLANGGSWNVLKLWRGLCNW